LNINADGTLNGNANSRWTYNAPWLQMDWSNGYTDKVFVQKGRDWENKKIPSYFQALITRELLFGERKNNYRTGMIIRTNI
jgi:arabinan endo-1,5-alpha-L-arabinosidase